jgi:hypothetical protein
MEYTEGTIVESSQMGDGQSLAIRAHQVTAITPASYADVIGLGRAIRAVIDGITGDDAPEIAKAYQLHKSLIKKRDDKVAPLEIAYARLKHMIGVYDQEQERLRREQERVAQEALRKQQEEEAMREAEALQNAGDAEGAEAVISQAAASPAPAVVIPSNVPKVFGKSSREIWRWRLKDRTKVKPEYLEPNELAISQVVRALKKNAEAAVGGIEVYSDTSVSLR